jgi:hypothetical protein
MKILIAAYAKLCVSHTNIWKNIIDILCHKYGWTLLDKTVEARRWKRYKIYKTESIIDDLKKFKDVKEVFFFNLTMFLSAIYHDIDKLKHHDTKLYGWVEESWHDNKFLIQDAKYYDLIFTPGPKSNTIKYIKDNDAKIHQVRYSCALDCDMPLNKNPEKVVLFSGTVSDVYPHRQEIVKSVTECKGNKDDEDEDFIALKKVRILPAKTKYIRGKYAQFINRHIASIASPGIVDGDYFYVKKFYEIPCSGALLLIYTDEKSIPELNELGFIDRVNCIISTDMNSLRDNIDEITDDKNRENVDKIRACGKNFVKKYNMVHHSVARMIDIIKKEI